MHVTTSSASRDHPTAGSPPRGRGPPEPPQQVKGLLTFLEGCARAAASRAWLSPPSPLPAPSSSASEARSDHGPHPSIQVHDLGAGGAR